MTLEEKRERLRVSLRGHELLMVAYSGGVDSAYLAWEAHEVLGDRMTAVIADSPSLARTQMKDAVEFAREWGIPLRVVQTEEMERAEYVRNDGARCFHCKDELFRVMRRLQDEAGGVVLAYGKNMDDAGEFRPGQRAAAMHGVVAPLADAGMGKVDVRELARRAGLRVWEKPASACLASRLEYGRPVTVEALRQVEEAEEALFVMGFKQVRVRHHGELARVEIAREEMPMALTMEMMDRLSAGVRAAGFKYVAVDAEGYRTGSMNAVLPVETLLAGGR